MEKMTSIVILQSPRKLGGRRRRESNFYFFIDGIMWYILPKFIGVPFLPTSRQMRELYLPTCKVKHGHMTCFEQLNMSGLCIWYFCVESLSCFCSTSQVPVLWPDVYRWTCTTSHHRDNHSYSEMLRLTVNITEEASCLDLFYIYVLVSWYHKWYQDPNTGWVYSIFITWILKITQLTNWKYSN